MLPIFVHLNFIGHFILNSIKYCMLFDMVRHLLQLRLEKKKNKN